MNRRAGAVVWCLVLAGPAIAQTTATVSGVVTDSSEAVVSGATVDAVAVDRVVARATTNEDGRYSLQVPQGVR
jgi:hypothetical protein